MLKTPTEKLLEFQFPARAESLCGMREELRRVLEGCCRERGTVDCIVLAVSEACANIILHAYRDQGGDILVEVSRSASGLVFRLTDFARRKTCEEDLQPRPLEALQAGGLGCHIINEIMDEVKLVECPGECGNVLQLEKKLQE